MYIIGKQLYYKHVIYFIFIIILKKTAIAPKYFDTFKAYDIRIDSKIVHIIKLYTDIQLYYTHII